MLKIRNNLSRRGSVVTGSRRYGGSLGQKRAWKYGVCCQILFQNRPELKIRSRATRAAFPLLFTLHAPRSAAAPAVVMDADPPQTTSRACCWTS